MIMVDGNTVEQFDRLISRIWAALNPPTVVVIYIGLTATVGGLSAAQIREIIHLFYGISVHHKNGRYRCTAVKTALPLNDFSYLLTFTS